VATVAAAGVIAALVLAVYVTVLVIGGGFETLQDPGPAAVLVATVLVALAVQPVFVRVRRFLRHRLGVPAVAPFDLLRRLPESVAGELPAEEIPAHMVRVLAEGLRAQQTELWLHVSDEYRLAAAWPPSAETPDEQHPPIHAAGFAPGGLRHPIRQGSRELAVLWLEHDPPRSLSRLEQRLLEAYADQAGQVVTMLALRASLEQRRGELAEQTSALREARRQLLETRELERRLLERDLHDGAQQQLLALSLGVRLARQLADRSPERVDELLSRAADQTRTIERSLAQLSAGLYPRLLLTEGLPAALRASLASSVVPIVVSDEDPAMRQQLPAPVAEALYFVAVEAAQNAIKHADAGEVRIEFGRAGTTGVSLTVTDRGRGFDSSVVRTGAGLHNMAERLIDLGGRLEVESSRGRETNGHCPPAQGGRRFGELSRHEQRPQKPDLVGPRRRVPPGRRRQHRLHRGRREPVVGRHPGQ
jgi:signal transduction histidine kinase